MRITCGKRRCCWKQRCCMCVILAECMRAYVGAGAETSWSYSVLPCPRLMFWWQDQHCQPHSSCRGLYITAGTDCNPWTPMRSGTTLLCCGLQVLLCSAVCACQQQLSSSILKACTAYDAGKSCVVCILGWLQPTAAAVRPQCCSCHQNINSS